MSNPTGKGGFGEHKAHINKLGRPKSFDGLRKLVQQLYSERVSSADGKVVMSRLEIELRDMMHSKDPRIRLALMEIGFGKVPQEVDLNADGKVIIEIERETPDSALPGTASETAGD